MNLILASNNQLKKGLTKKDTCKFKFKLKCIKGGGGAGNLLRGGVLVWGTSLMELKKLYECSGKLMCLGWYRPTKYWGIDCSGLYIRHYTDVYGTATKRKETDQLNKPWRIMYVYSRNSTL